MTTEKTQEQAGAKPGLTVEEITTELETLKASHKSVQRELDKARRQGDATAALQEQLRTLTSTVMMLSDAIASGDNVDEATKAKVAQSRQTAAQQAETEKAAREHAQQIVESMEDTGLDWDTDPNLADAREAWNKGELKSSVRLTQKAVKMALKAEPKDLDKLVAERVQAELKKSGVRSVDTKESAAPATDSRKALNEIRMKPDGSHYREMQKQVDALLDTGYRK